MQSPVQRQCMSRCTPALPQLDLLCSRWYLQHLLQCLQEGNPISYTCDHVSTFCCTFSRQKVNCLKILPKKKKWRRGGVTKSNWNCPYSENTFLMEFSNSLNNQAEILVIYFTIDFTSPRCLCMNIAPASGLPRKQS